MLTPLDLEREFGLSEGNIFHGELTLDQLFFLRPVPGWARYSTPIRNLWMCGSATHPGGGIMGAPGRNAARTDSRAGELSDRSWRTMPPRKDTKDTNEEPCLLAPWCPRVLRGRLWRFAAMHDVVIIGGGHNGLVAAAFLAKAGLKTLVLERAEQVGGCAITSEIAPGFRCPTLAHRAAIDPAILRALDLARHGLEIVRPAARVWAPSEDGRSLTLWADADPGGAGDLGVLRRGRRAVSRNF